MTAQSTAGLAPPISSFSLTMVDPYRTDFLRNADLPADVKEAFLTRTQVAGTHWDDSYAQSLGFKKSTISGGVIKDHVMIAVTNAWGEDWFARGDFSMRFRRPLYDGDVVQATFSEPRYEDEATRVDFTVTNESGDDCVIGWLALPQNAPEPPSVHEFMASPLATAPLRVVGGDAFVGQRWESDPVLVPADTAEVVRAGESAFGPDIKSKILAIYAGLDAGRAELREKALLPPWVIGVGPRRGVDDTGEVFAMATVQDEKFFGLAALGEPLTVHNRLAGVFERKGASYYESDHLVVNGSGAIIAWRKWTVMVRPAGIES